MDIDRFLIDISWLLKDWQNLIGAIIGGVMGFIGANAVARYMNRREEKSAAMLIVLDLGRFSRFACLATKLKDTDRTVAKVHMPAGKPKYPVAMEPFHAFKRLLRSLPFLSPLYGSSMLRITLADEVLSALLSDFQTKIILYQKMLDQHLDWKVKHAKNEEIDTLYEANKELFIAVSKIERMIALINSVVMSRWAGPRRIFNRISRSKICQRVFGETKDMRALGDWGGEGG